MRSMNKKIGFNLTIVAASALAAASLLSGKDASATDATGTGTGAASIYKNIPPDQIEFLSTPDRIKSVAVSGSMTAIWETLEHGEKLECLDCIPAVEPLLYDANPQTREIAAWWLRRRMFGVFGPGEVYQRTLTTLASDADATRRANAAYAIGEFLASPGAAALATSVRSDGDPNVRAAAASALGRLNDEGSGAISTALTDVDSRVKNAALASAGRINTFTDVASVARLTGDADPVVRRKTADLLGAMKSGDSVDSLDALATDSDAQVRAATAHALGLIADPRSKAALTALSTDSNSLVRDQAAIALRHF